MTGKKADHWSSIVKSRQLKMLAASIAVGVIAGLFIANVRLHLGLPGHKALFWMTPVIVARLLGRCRAGTTAGALSAAFTTFVLGSHLAGGVLGLPLIGFAGIILDAVINFLEKRKMSALLVIPIIGFTAMLANLLCLVKRLLVPLGHAPQLLFGISGFWLKLASYAFFGLMAGLIAAMLACLINRRRCRLCDEGKKAWASFKDSAARYVEQ